MYGVPDRGGGRENKKSSLRKNKQALADAAKAATKGHSQTAAKQSTSLPPPRLLSNGLQPAIIDCGSQLLNRQFDKDQLKVLSRASAAGIHGIMVFTTDFEKEEALVRLAKENSGTICAMVGVHTDMIKRNNDKLSAARLDALRDMAVRSEVVAIMTGLDFSRDVGIRYAQEKALQQQMEVAEEVALPLMLYEVGAADALAEKLAEFKESRHGNLPRTALYGFNSTAEALHTFLELGCWIVVNGAVADPTARGVSLREIIQQVPLDKLLVASDAPFNTPQNIADAYVRDGRNEPSNLPHVLEALAPVFQETPEQLAARLFTNAVTFFGLTFEEPPTTAALAPADHADTTAAAPTVGHGEERRTAISEVGDSTAAAHDMPHDGGISGSDAESPDDSDEERPQEHGGSNRTVRGQRRTMADTPAVVPRRARKNLARATVGEGDTGIHAAGVQYACRACQTILFEEKDIQAHQDAACVGRAQFDSEAERCNMHFLRGAMPWMQSGQLDGSEGRLLCPECSAKLGKWAVVGGVQCSCGVQVLAPVYGVLRSRLDLIDPQQELSAAVATSLQLYEEGSEGSGGWSDDGARGKGRKKKSKMRRDKTANFSSFRNKSYNTPAAKSTVTKRGLGEANSSAVLPEDSAT